LTTHEPPYMVEGELREPTHELQIVE